MQYLISVVIVLLNSVSDVCLSLTKGKSAYFNRMKTTLNPIKIFVLRTRTSLAVTNYRVQQIYPNNISQPITVYYFVCFVWFVVLCAFLAPAVTVTLLGKHQSVACCMVVQAQSHE